MMTETKDTRSLMGKSSTYRAAYDQHPGWSLRLVLVCFSALSVSLPMAWISLAKVLVLIVGLAYCVRCLFKCSSTDSGSVWSFWTPRVVLVAICLFGISCIWSEADAASAFVAFLKHAKLLELLLLTVLIRNAAEAQIGISAFAAGQVFLLLSSWAMFIGVPVPWNSHYPRPYVVFSSYLDQSIMFAISSSVFWHLRDYLAWPKWMSIALAALALTNTLWLLDGRSGYVIALILISLAIMWAMPRRLRLVTMAITPMVLLSVLYLSSPRIHERMNKMVQESQNFSETQHLGEQDSSGWRLNAWRRSIQAIQQKPLLGHGVGSWTPVVKRLEGATALSTFGQSNQGNPHQEYLLWFVELGVIGLILLVAILASLTRDAMRFPSSVQRTLLSVVAAVTVACLFNSSLYDDLIGDYFCVGLGLLFALGVRSERLSS